MALTAEVSQNVKKGALFLLGNEFTLQFEPAYLRTHFHEYQVLLENLKKLRQLTFDVRRNWWTIPVADDAIACLQQLVAWGIMPTTDARNKLGVAMKAQAEQRAAVSIKTEEKIELILPHAPELNAAMMNYQKAGVVFMSKLERAYNGDDMGTGKSLQALAALELSVAYPALILCPVKLKQNWIRECRKWLPHRKASMFTNDLAEITILGYSEVHKYVNWGLCSTKKKEKEAAKLKAGKRFFYPDFVKLEAVVCDESHWIKVNASRRTLCAIAIAKHCDSRVRFCLSGTPIENNNVEMMAPMTFLGVMDKMGGWFHVAQRYCGAKRNNFGWDLTGSTNSIEFHRKCAELFYIRRRKQDVLKDLPDKLISIQDSEIDNEPEYRKIEADVIAYMMEQKGALLNRGQIDAKHLLRLNALRQAVGKGKVAGIIEWVDEFLESGEKFVLYAYHRDVLNALVSGLAHHNPATVLGGCLDVQREQDKFMKDESCRLFIGSIVAAGFGLTLTRASHIGICELMWTHSKHEQAVDRVHRIGQKDCVNAYYFLASGTIDDDMWSVVSEKAKIVTATVDGEEVPPAEALENLVRKYSTKRN